jgi:UDP-N-acetyl-D-mannosaminuronate dehydrogenase
MLLDPKFGPAAQTPEQRIWVLEQMQRVIPGIRNKACAYTQGLYTRYVAGELSWSEVYQARKRFASR